MSEAAEPRPLCTGCLRRAEEVREFVREAEHAGVSADEWVRENEGTYNPANGHFLCTERCGGIAERAGGLAGAVKKGVEAEVTVHLLRGSPSVREWSKHEKTVPLWTLCGIKRRARKDSGVLEPEATEFDVLVSCSHCLDLLDIPRDAQPSRAARARIDFQAFTEGRHALSAESAS